MPASVPPPAVPFREALGFWFRLGWISFGGPAGQIAIMHQELVERRRWISERRFLHALSFCMVLPGPEAQQLATYLGWLLHRRWGGIVAGALFVLPSLLVLGALSYVYMAHGDVPAVRAVLWGIKPVVVALVVHAVWRLGSRALRTPFHWVLGLGALGALMVGGVPFPLVVLVAAVAGFLVQRTTPGWLAPLGAHRPASEAPRAPALIDDDTPTPPHARPSRWGLITVLVAGLALWGLAYLPMRVLGAGGTYGAMAGFFTKAALVTFGGAYSVLPYVYQAAVHQYGWLTPPQMIDGLALGETTPGPLIMVVAFVGFVGGWNQQALGPEALALAGVLGAVVATFFTFLPSFVFILAGAPLVEATRDDLRLTAPLEAISAAVVGVILQLALVLGGHIFWPAGLASAPEWASLLVGATAAVALFRFRLGAVAVVGGGAVAGLLRLLLGPG